MADATNHRESSVGDGSSDNLSSLNAQVFNTATSRQTISIAGSVGIGTRDRTGNFAAAPSPLHRSRVDHDFYMRCTATSNRRHIAQSSGIWTGDDTDALSEAGTAFTIGIKKALGFKLRF